MILNGKNGLFATLDIGTASLEDVKNGTVPILPACKVCKPVAITVAPNFGAYFVQTDDGKIHIVSVAQAFDLNLTNMGLPEITV